MRVAPRRRQRVEQAGGSVVQPHHLSRWIRNSGEESIRVYVQRCASTERTRDRERYPTRVALDDRGVAIGVRDSRQQTCRGIGERTRRRSREGVDGAQVPPLGAEPIELTAVG